MQMSSAAGYWATRGRSNLMETYDEFFAMAALCARNSRIATSKEVAAELWRMAIEYQERAAKLDGGKQPEIGHRPSGI
jgi:hypothetical protein